MSGPVRVAAPIVGPVHVAHRTIVNVELSSPPDLMIMSGSGARLRPAFLMIEYLDGWLWLCSVRGKKVRLDGHEYIDGSYDERSYMRFTNKPGSHVARRRELSDRAPQWVQQLVEQYAPRDLHDERNW